MNEYKGIMPTKIELTLEQSQQGVSNDVLKGYRCYSPQLYRYLVSRDVTFHEDLPYFLVTTYRHQEENDDLLVYVSPTPVETTKQSAELDGDGPPLKVYARRPRITSDLVCEPSTQLKDAPIDAPNDAPNDVSNDVPISAPSEAYGKSDAPSDAPSGSDSPPPSPAPEHDLPISLWKGKRTCRHLVSAFVSYDGLSTSSCAFVANLDSILVPKIVGEALAHSGWRVAMIEEMNALVHNGTWALVDLHAYKKPIGCKWVFSFKMKPDGSIARLKPRLVAKGYAQTYGIDYPETFSPVAKISSIRLFISLAATYDWALHQLDVKNAFLHGDLEEEVYMEQPPGFIAQGEYGRVCKLKKALYGLKQSLCAWFGKFSNSVIEFGLRRSVYDHSIFYSSSHAGCILLVVYVDDIVITGSDKGGIKKLKSFIGTCFQMKALGSLKYFLGIKVSCSSKGICLSQRKYCLDLLDDAGQIKAKSCDEPMIPKLKLRSKDGRLLHNPEKYRRVVGKQNYLTITRPDIAFPVSVVSQFLTAPRTSHWDAVTQILGYLKGTLVLGILYSNHGHHIAEGFTDVDYAGCPNTSCYTTRYCVFVGGNLVSWKSKK
ncbi:retrovirus-related pol polyprotein from transposon TNT 1-94 [Tanacetum coccineum]